MAKLTVDQAVHLARRHHEAGQLAEAERLYRQILARQPDRADVLCLLGIVAAQAGQHEPAVELMRRAIALQPSCAEYHSHLAASLKELGRIDDAAGAYRKAIDLKADFFEAQNNLAALLADAGQLDEAIGVYRAMAALKPHSAEVHFDLGSALARKGLHEAAVSSLRQALRLDPHHYQAWNALGMSLVELRQIDDAIDAYRQALRCNAGSSQVHYNLGSALALQGAYDAAIDSCDTALRLNPDYPKAHNNRGNALSALGRRDEAILAYHRALELEPDLVESHCNLATVFLIRGDFERGWKQYEWRWKQSDTIARATFLQPRWDGENLHGQTILLHAEQGCGDTIQFIRYVPHVARRGGRVIVQCQPELRRLIRNMPGIDTLCGPGPLPSFDVHCPLLSLPLAFQTQLETIPAELPYLHPDPQLIESWSKKLGPSHKRLRVGLAWAGNPHHKEDARRSLALEQLAPFSKHRDIIFYSLQKGPASAQAAHPPTGMELIDVTSQLSDFADTAALIANLDLVIAVDTSVAHLAGALGRRAWVMLPFQPDWRWLLERTDSPWYPTLRLFRQTSPGDWAGVIARMTAALAHDLD